ncbi:xanthine dehydrogenase family protein molybdopterin-binding subunit [Jannaschia sp. CCS1]|uniref:xanthine dehydrogenase family protein molybdopterin-binding subunit n=1 Tax=Jannaschia sp. (strain CCS1) TaxID=290400 RepID=UPI000053A817|nr:molybdopterin cofactor-binding domain-containing protein [Jannaschia sp. CCS1]ABD57085.1 Twin-arginine translocation pathway signal [Jannaschia sp. CCS1]
MGKLKTFTRRAFLVGSAAVAGGVAFGTYLVARDPDNPNLQGLAEGAASFNPWVRIDATGITLVTPHADIGQGAASMQAALIAEEMDLDWADFEIDFGRPAPAYWNTAMAGESAPVLPWDDSFGAQAMRSTVGSLLKVIGMQGTGGSTSTPDSYVKLREAGAMARETLKLAASQRTGISFTEMRTEGAAVHLPDGTAIPYVDLATEAAGLEPVQGTPLRDPSTWRLVGKDMPRIDIVPKSTGAPIYGLDIELPDMARASLRMNPRKGGALNGFDASTAEAMQGVERVLGIPGGVAVIATNTWYAMQALDAIDYDWGPAPYAPEQADHWAALEQAFTEENLDSEWLNIGDVEADIPSATTIEAEYRAPYVAHQPLEPLNAVVLVEDDGAQVWTGHQMPRFLQQQVAAITGHDADQITLHNQYAGGSFGHRLEFDYVKQAVQIAMQMRGRPVKLTYSRETDFAQDFPRQITMGRGRGAVLDGQVVSFDTQIAAPSVVRSQVGRMGQSVPGPDSQLAAGVWQQPYGVENTRMRAYAVEGLSPVSSWRSVGASANGFIGEGFLDELIHAAGADPLEERIRLCTLDDISRQVLEAVGEMSNWGEALPEGTGRGVALVHAFGVPCAEVVEVTMTDAGIRLNTVWVAADVGRVVDPVNFDNIVKGGVIWGLGHAINSEITYTDGIADQTNFHAHEGMRMHQTPEIFVRGLENGHVRGIGEPPVPPAPPALANAIFAATGQRIREMPFWNHIDFV